MTKEEYFYKHPKDETISILNYLGMRYGPNTTLKEAIIKYQDEHYKGKFVCPKCNGNGYTVTEYNAYPSGLPDSGWVYKPGYDYEECDLCNGKGYTEKEYKAKTETKIIGYEEV